MSDSLATESLIRILNWLALPRLEDGFRPKPKQVFTPFSRIINCGVFAHMREMGGMVTGFDESPATGCLSYPIQVIHDTTPCNRPHYPPHADSLCFTVNDPYGGHNAFTGLDSRDGLTREDIFHLVIQFDHDEFAGFDEISYPYRIWLFHPFILTKERGGYPSRFAAESDERTQS